MMMKAISITIFAFLLIVNPLAVAMRSSRTVASAGGVPADGEGAVALVAHGTESDSDAEKAEDDEDDGDDEADEETEKEKKAMSAKIAKLNGRITRNLAKQIKVKLELAGLDDVNGSAAAIDSKAKIVANDTQSEALAEFLGDMHKELQMFSSPFYKEHLQDKLEFLEEKRERLAAELEQANDKLRALDRDEDEDDDEKDAPKAKSAEKPEQASETDAAESKHVPMFTKETMPAVSPTARCVMQLTFQYFILYSLLAIIRTVNQFTDQRYAHYQEIMDTLCSTVSYAPMLAVLFLATRMRAIQLTQGDTEKYALPSPWTQAAMYAATSCVLNNVMFVLVASVYAAPVAQDDAPPARWSAHKVATMLQKVNTIVLYLATVMVIYGALSMQAPKELWQDAAPMVPPALTCTITLTVNFFAVHLGWAFCQGYNRVRDFDARGMTVTDERVRKLEQLFDLAKNSVNLAPMLCILFIAARMRALQIDPVAGNPQPWAQNCFYACTLAVVAQSLLFLMPIFDATAEIQRGPMRGEFVVRSRLKSLKVLLNAVRYIALIGMYGGACGVMVSIHVLQAPEGEVTPAVAPAVHCIIFLATVYFSVYTLVFAAYTLQEFLDGSSWLDRLLGVFEAGQKTVMFAPMLCMLFITARMRALQLTRTVDGKVPVTAGPQAWAQEGMYAASWAVFVQLVMSYCMAIIFGSGKNLDEDIKLPVEGVSGWRKYLGIFAEIIKYSQMIAMYGGAMAVMVGIYAMTPETLPPYAAPEGLLPGVVVAAPPSF